MYIIEIIYKQLFLLLSNFKIFIPYGSKYDHKYIQKT